MTDKQEAASAKRKATCEARRAARAAQWEQERKDRELVADAMRGVLSDQGATNRERIFATLVIDHITGGIVPSKAKQLYDSKVDLDVFKEAVDAMTSSTDKH